MANLANFTQNSDFPVMIKRQGIVDTIVLPAQTIAVGQTAVVTKTVTLPDAEIISSNIEFKEFYFPQPFVAFVDLTTQYKIYIDRTSKTTATLTMTAYNGSQSPTTLADTPATFRIDMFDIA